jgi:hypothetical protein
VSYCINFIHANIAKAFSVDVKQKVNRRLNLDMKCDAVCIVDTSDSGKDENADTAVIGI